MLRRVVGLALLGLLGVGAACAEKQQVAMNARVGMTTRVFHPKDSRNWRQAEHKELRCTVWYPAVESSVETKQMIGPPDAPLFEAGMAARDAALIAGKKLPLVLLSHGTGGSAMQMAWLGEALARAGFIAVAVDHPGNNSDEPYTKEGFTLWWERVTDLSQVLDGMLADEEFGKRIDEDRVGAAGFSLGGYTVMELAGAQSEISEFLDLCRGGGDAAVCHIPEMRGMGSLTEILAAVRKTSAESLARSNALYVDDRVGAVFAIAPALAFTFTDDSLHDIRVPVEMVVGNADTIAPAKENANWIRDNSKGARVTVLGGGVGHYTFLEPCTTAGKQSLGVYCEDGRGVEREAVHAQVAGMAVSFFLKTLRPVPRR